MTLAEILAEGVLLLQKHYDPRGSEVTDAMTIDQAGAVLFNFYEDWLIALQTKVDEVVSTPAALSVKDTRTTGATTTSSIASAGSANFTISMPTDRVSVQWLRVKANNTEGYTPSAESQISFYADADRTQLVYQSNLVSGVEADATADFVDGMAWGAFADNGDGLEENILYGTIVNDGDAASTFTVRVVALAY